MSFLDLQEGSRSYFRRSSSLYYMIQGFTMRAQIVRSFIAIPLQKCPDSAQKGLKLYLERSANYVKSEASVRVYLLQMLRSEIYGSRLQFPSTQLHHRLGCYVHHGLCERLRPVRIVDDRKSLHVSSIAALDGHSRNS